MSKKIFLQLLIIFTLLCIASQFAYASSPKKAIKIQKINNLSAAINFGDKYNLPKTVVGIKNDGTKSAYPVQWNPAKVDIKKAGKYTFRGKVSGYGKEVIISLDVKNWIKTIESLNVTITQNEQYKLPTDVNTLMADGTEKKRIVKWTNTAVNTSSVGTTVYEGTVTGYSKKISLSLSIEKRTLKIIGYADLIDIANTDGISPSKEWQIEFNEKLEDLPLIKNKVYIVSKDTGFVFPIELKANSSGKALILKHDIPFSSGGAYTLHISKNLKTHDGLVALENSYTIDFDVSPDLIINELNNLYGGGTDYLIKKRSELKSWNQVEYELYKDQVKTLRIQQNIWDEIGGVQTSNSAQVTITGIQNNEYVKEGYSFIDVLTAIRLSAVSGKSVDEIMKVRGRERDNYYDGEKFVYITGQLWNSAIEKLGINVESIALRLGMQPEHIEYMNFRSLSKMCIIDAAIQLSSRNYDYSNIPANLYEPHSEYVFKDLQDLLKKQIGEHEK